MKQKIEVINTIDINEDLVILVAKKIKTEPMRCKHCSNAQDIEGFNNNKYCLKYKSIVALNEVCIEEGM